MNPGPKKKTRVPSVVSCLAVVAFACAYGALRIHAVDAATEAAPAAKVGIAQANMGLQEKRSSYDEGLRRHLQLVLRPAAPTQPCALALSHGAACGA